MVSMNADFDAIVIGSGIASSHRTQIASGQQSGTSTGDAWRIAELEREVQELKHTNQILKKNVLCYWQQEKF